MIGQSPGGSSQGSTSSSPQNNPNIAKIKPNVGLDVEPLQLLGERSSLVPSQSNQNYLGSSTNQGTDTQASTQTLVCSDATSTDETNDEIKIESQPIFSTYGPNSNELSQLFDGTHADINPDQSGSVDLTQYCILIGDLVGDTSNNTVSVPALVKAENKEGACEEENGPKYGLIDCIMIGSTVPLPMASTSDGLVKREHDVVSGDIPYIVTVRLV